MRQGAGINVMQSQRLGNTVQVFPVPVVEHEWRARSAGQLGAEADAEVLQKTKHITAPPGGHSGGAEGILQDQVPANDPGENLTQSGVAVSVGRAGDGNHGGELGVAEAGENAANPGNDKGKNDGGPGVHGRGRSRQNENAGADNGADSQGNQVARSQGALQAV